MPSPSHSSRFYRPHYIYNLEHTSKKINLGLVSDEDLGSFKGRVMVQSVSSGSRMEASQCAWIRIMILIVYVSTTVLLHKVIT